MRIVGGHYDDGDSPAFGGEEHTQVGRILYLPLPSSPSPFAATGEPLQSRGILKAAYRVRCFDGANLGPRYFLVWEDMTKAEAEAIVSERAFFGHPAFQRD